MILLWIVRPLFNNLSGPHGPLDPQHEDWGWGGHQSAGQGSAIREVCIRGLEGNTDSDRIQIANISSDYHFKQRHKIE